MSNRLATEPSPYLLQHANNPVDWYPWGNEAFAKARDDEKPLFVSVGYSTCHWCHVMEHESFENPEVARVLNEHFVSIKVDREERPDIDRVYMLFVQTTTGSGGWPMSVWLTPELKPFFGGTYFPPESRFGRPGFTEILREIARLWKEDRSKLLASADALIERLRHTQTQNRLGVKGGKVGVSPSEALEEGVTLVARAFDATHGGFGGAPKFPRPSEVLFLFREYARSGSLRARDMAVTTLWAMASGGMRDHIGGGFHRYSIDAEWRVPHFEKMLYDQAQLTLAYLEGWQVTREAGLLRIAEDTLEYVARDLTSSGGAFYSAEDADSVPPENAGRPDIAKAEGAFYLWTEVEIDALLGDDAEIVRRHYGIEKHGNAPHDPMGEFKDKNILRLQQDVCEISRLVGRSAEEITEVLTTARTRLFEARSQRPKPDLDDKVLTSGNGLMIAAFARAARVCKHTRFLAMAQRAAAFIRDFLWDTDAERLSRRYRNGQTSIQAYSEDYAFLVWGLLELFQADGNPEWLSWATTLQRKQDELFWDDEGGGWFSTTGQDPSILLRLKEEYDGAEPSASSVSALNLLTLGHLTGNSAWMGRVERTLGRYGLGLTSAVRILPMMTAALSVYHAGASQIVIVGEQEAGETRILWQRVAAHYLPFTVHVPVEPGAAQEQIANQLPFVGGMKMVNGKPTSYVCTNFECQEPVSDLAAFDRQLERL